jgi:hypothetical protein
VTTVYLATRGEYSDYRVCHAFASREDAESYKLGEDVMELEVRDGPVEVRRWYHLTWRGDRADRMGEDGRGLPNPYVYAGDERDFNGDERHVEHRWSKGHLQAENTGNAHLEVEGWDVALVKKVYSEQRAQYLARKEGIA